jgi:tetratricopeptide (TPR) repeat protein
MVNCLNSLAASRALDGEVEEALQAAQEAVECCKILLDADPDKYIPRMAGTLHTMSVIAHPAGALSDSEAAAKLSAQVFEVLAAREPGIYVYDLIRSLRNLGSIQAETGSLSSALENSSRCVDLCRWLLNVDMVAYLPDLAECLRSHSVLLMKSQDVEASWLAAVESVILLLWLDSLQPDKHLKAIVRVMMHFKDVAEKRASSEGEDDFPAAASGVLLGISRMVSRTPFGFKVGDYEFIYERISENKFSITRKGPSVVSNSE